ncbi:MAG: cell division protein FtsQ/DivIB [Actinomycetota bacterium]|nr:cell division protein FtsQ/DivIB [Actinomycetota bacterium]
MAAAAVALAAASALAYLLARETPLFSVEKIELAGGSREARRQGDALLERLEGQSLVSVDGDELERRLEALPAIRAARVDRAFPHTLAVGVEGERPLAIVRASTGAALVSVRGRVIRSVERGSLAGLPRIRGAGTADPRPGEALHSDRITRAVRVLAAVPPGFPLTVVAVRVRRSGDVILALGGRVELRLGPATRLGQKLEAAAAVLRALGPADRRRLAYVDVALPDRVVAARKHQVSSES